MIYYRLNLQEGGRGGMGRRELRDIAVKCLFQYDFICRENEIKELAFCKKPESGASVWTEKIALQNRRKGANAERCHAVILGRDSEFSAWDNFIVKSKPVDFCCGNTALKEKKESRLFSLTEACADSFGTKYFSREKKPTAYISYKKSSSGRSANNNGDYLCAFKGDFDELLENDEAVTKSGGRLFVSSAFADENASYSYGVPYSVDKVKPRTSETKKELVWYSTVNLELYWDKLAAGDYTVFIIGSEKDSPIPGYREILTGAVDFTLLDSFDELKETACSDEKDVVLCDVSVDSCGYTFITDSEKLSVLCKNADAGNQENLCVFTCSSSKALSNYYYGDAKCPENSFDAENMIERLCEMCAEDGAEEIDYTADEEYESYFVSVVKGTVENIAEIDRQISENTIGWTFDRISRIDLAILRVAVYEILYRDDVPAVVAINEAIETAKKYSSEKSGTFINGVLGGVYAASGQESDI